MTMNGWYPTDEWLAECFSYKPGFKFTVQDNRPVSYGIRMTAVLPDSRVQSEMTVSVPPGLLPRIEVATVFPWFGSEGWKHEVHFAHWMRGELGHFEWHERDEWIRLRGELIFDPHADGRMTL